MAEKIIGLKELRENTEDYIKKVKKGQSFLVVRKSRPVFRLSSPDIDDGVWEEVIDFTQIDPKGVTIEKVEKTLTRMLKK